MERWRYCALSEFISITLPAINVWVGLNFRTEFFDDLLGDVVDLAGDTVDLPPGEADFFCLGNVCDAIGAGERSMIIWLEDDVASTEDDFSSTEDDFASKEDNFASTEDNFASMEDDFTSTEEDFSSAEEDSASM